MIKEFVPGAIIIGYYSKHQFHAMKRHDNLAQGNALGRYITNSPLLGRGDRG